MLPLALALGLATPTPVPWWHKPTSYVAVALAAGAVVYSIREDERRPINGRSRAPVAVPGPLLAIALVVLSVNMHPAIPPVPEPPIYDPLEDWAAIELTEIPLPTIKP